jgi:hypothetical protein
MLGAAVNVLQGTFRLSILVGILALAYNAYDASQAAGRQAHRDWELWFTLRCGHRLMQTHDLTKHENQFGNFDLGKLGCASRTFWANTREVEDASRRPDPYQETWSRVWWSSLPDGALNAFSLFVLTNLLGVAFLGMRRAYRWVSAGYKGGA